MWLFMLIFAFWNIDDGDNRKVSRVLLLFLLLAINPLWNFRDWTTEYSGEKCLGEFIGKNLPREDTIYITGTNFVSAYVPDYTMKEFAPQFIGSDDLDRRIDVLFNGTKSDSVVLVLSKLRIGGWSYPVSHRFDTLYESSEIMANMYQFLVLRVYR